MLKKLFRIIRVREVEVVGMDTEVDVEVSFVYFEIYVLEVVILYMLVSLFYRILLKLDIEFGIVGW